MFANVVILLFAFFIWLAAISGLWFFVFLPFVLLILYAG